MTKLLEQAIAQLKTLPITEQDAIANRYLKEIGSTYIEMGLEMTIVGRVEAGEVVTPESLLGV